MNESGVQNELTEAPAIGAPYVEGDNVSVASEDPEVQFAPRGPLTKYEEFYNKNVDPQLPVSDGRWEAALQELGLPEDATKEQIEAALDNREVAAANPPVLEQTAATLEPSDESVTELAQDAKDLATSITSSETSE